MESTSLYTCDDISTWKSTLRAYEDVLKLKADKEGKIKKDKNLIALDHWYQNELPQILHGREKTFLKLDELSQVMKWKLTRGKFRPRLTELVKTNSESMVEDVSYKAFSYLPDISSAVRELSKLKGVGPATASAILAAVAPHLVPFMADEAMLAVPGLGDIDYKLPFYIKFVQKLTKVVEKLKLKDKETDWTAHKVELALWTAFMAKKLNYVISTPENKENVTEMIETTPNKRKKDFILEDSEPKQQVKLRRSSRKK